MGVNDAGGSLNAVLPEQFGKYSLIGHLATGGMAEVWLARQVGLQGFEKTVVIKRARPELTDRDTTRRFLDEARLVATLEHPNIAQVYEIGFVSGSYFFVMEYVDGADLRRLIKSALAKRYPVSIADALYIVTQICAALHYAHEKHDLEGNPLQIIHRDVSPSNVLISHDGVVKVCDFGIAKAHHGSKAEDTRSGVVKGKFSYMSPEQCRSQPIDRRSDVFSIGVLMYELTTLSKLFRARTEYELLQRVVEAKIPPPSSRVPGYPRELEQIVLRALAKDPAERYPTAQLLQLDLEAFAREHKLAMSSVGIAMLMKTLIEKRSDLRVRGSRPKFNDLGELESSPGSERYAFADGSAQSPGAERTPEPSRVTFGPRLSSGTASASAMTQAPPRRAPVMWLTGAVLAGLCAGAVSVADQMMSAAEERMTTSSLAGDAERLAAVFDTATRSAQLRADGIATTPMLRAAIETDAATVRDLANNEMVFTAAPGESLEVFQFSGGKSVSLLRIPKTAPPLQPVTGREVKLRSDGLGVTLVASVPVSGYRSGIAGGIVISTPVDLSAARRALEAHSYAASLSGLGSDLALSDAHGAPGGSPMVLAVPSVGAWTSTAAKLVATPKRAAGLGWAAPVRYTSGALGLLLLIGFALSLRRPPQVVPPPAPPAPA